MCVLALTALASRPAGAQAVDCRKELARKQADVLTTFPREVASLRDAIARADGPLVGYELSHGDVVLAGMGVTLTQFSDPDRPELLFYWPMEAPPSEWLDFDGEDGPYELVGWGLIPDLYPVATEPPATGCVPAEAWFVHEAGFHLLDDGMHPTPGSRLEEPEPPAELEGRILYWHPAGWDVHFWIREDVPEISLLDPEAEEGGLRLPAEVFWYPEASR